VRDFGVTELSNWATLPGLDFKAWEQVLSTSLMAPSSADVKCCFIDAV